MRTNKGVFMLKPLGKRVLIKPVEMKAGVLFVSGAKPVQYEVMGLGDEVTKVAIGNIIYLEKHYGAEIEHNKEKFLVVEEASILAKVLD
jgi:co-chaperonin GroES (HSP10)